jgi:cellobiose phosphorylase
MGHRVGTPQCRRRDNSDMPEAHTDPEAICLSSGSGLQVEINANGSVRRFYCDPISLTLFVGNEIEGGPTNLYLRRHSDTVEWTPLLGPRSPTRFDTAAADGILLGVGAWQGINYSIALVLAQDVPAWFWHVRLKNTTSTRQSVDLTYAQDLALAPYGAVRLNEYYVSQYIDHTPLRHSVNGFMIASRQNLAAELRNPWCLIGSLRQAMSFSTDSMQFYGLASRRGDTPVGLATDPPSRRLQHEHSMVVIRDAPIRLDPNQSIAAGFFGSYLADHPAATSSSDLERVSRVLTLAEAAPVALESRVAEPPSSTSTLFSSAPLLNGLDLGADALRALFGSHWRHEELDERGERLSFFYGADRHVVMRAKELRVRRPHGHLLRTGRHLTPDESALTSTVWMSGVFHSMLTQGHVSINRFVSTVHSYLGLFRSHGQRVFMHIGGAWRLLNAPSAFEMSPDACRWIYRHDQGVVEVRAEARSEPHELTLSIDVMAGEAVRFLICHHIALNGDDGSTAGAAHWWRDGDDIIAAPAPGSELAQRFPSGSFTIAPMPGTAFQHVGGDELLFHDGRSRQQPYLCVITAVGRSAGLRIRGQLIAEASQTPLRVPGAESLIPRLTMTAAGSAFSEHVARMADIVPWYTHNALVHYLSPRGLEQYSGGGWGTRDVCQGPVEMLLALGRVAPIRDVLLRVMAAQNADGDWPQWFMFFDRERDIRAGDSHGDIVFWPLVVLAEYLLASGDASVLEQGVPFFDPRGSQAGETASVWEHVQRAVAVMEQRVIPGTALAAYGHGDWNDSLQPVDPALRDHMCSAWNVTLHFQALTTMARALRAIGRAQQAPRFERWAESVQRDFQRLLVVDGVVAGYAVFEDGGCVRYLLHPRDDTTGVRYSALAMIHAIIEDMLTPVQARDHLRLIDTHLSAPDGVRLFDRPMPYHGGPQRIFQRAESATFFGREIGLMYTHAHLRYAQALAHVGEAERFFHALCLANPIGIRSIVPSGTLRQANCYYSSSDAAFDDRYQASAQYERVARGTVALDGGWRVYSSGAGIALGLITRCFLGLSCDSQALRVDPVIPSALDGLRVQTTLLGRAVEVQYRIGNIGWGVNEIVLNGQPLSFTRHENPHRRGAVSVAMASLLQRLAVEGNMLRIEIG